MAKGGSLDEARLVVRCDGHAEAVKGLRNLDLAGQTAVRLTPVGESEDGLLVRFERRPAVHPVCSDVDMAGAATRAAAADGLDLPGLADVEHERAAGPCFDLLGRSITAG